MDLTERVVRKLSSNCINGCILRFNSAALSTFREKRVEVKHAGIRSLDCG